MGTQEMKYSIKRQNKNAVLIRNVTYFHWAGTHSFSFFPSLSLHKQLFPLFLYIYIYIFLEKPHHGTS